MTRHGLQLADQLSSEPETRRIRISWRKLERLYMIRALASGQIARQFRLQARQERGEIETVPVFAQHAPGPLYLAEKLDHLTRNGYATLDTAEYHAWLTGESTLERPAVMLTFDDGLRRYYEVTFPELEKRGLKSVLFVCPGLVELASTGEGKLNAFMADHVLTWDELRRLHATGLVDIQSHGMWHNAVRVSETPVGRATDLGDDLFDVLDLLPPDGRIDALADGTAVAAPAPRYPSHPFYQCSDRNHADDLRCAKELIEANLLRHCVRAFAFPWWNGVDGAVQAARAEGYNLVFHGMRGMFGSQRRAYINPLRIGRMGFDWISCLPGDGAKSVVTLVSELYRGQHPDDRS